MTNKLLEQPTRFQRNNQINLFYDTESDMKDPFNVKLISFIIADVNGVAKKTNWPTKYKGICYTTEVGQFIRFVDSLLKKFQIINLFAHNGGKWDHHLILLKHFIVHTAIKDKIKSAKYYQMTLNNGKEIYFRDTLSFFPMPLKRMGEMIKCSKLDCDLEASVETLIPYCCTDTLILLRGYQWLRDYLIPLVGADFRIGSFLSLPDIAYFALRISIPDAIYMPESIKDLNILSQCYYGGRVCSSIYGMHIKEAVVALDVRSLYPLALTGNLPWGKLQGPIDYLHPDKLGVYYVELSKTNHTCIDDMNPILPIRDALNNIVFINSGTIKGYYTSVDINTFLLDQWTLKQVIIGWYWEEEAPYCKEFYQCKYNERKKFQKDDPTNTCIKLLMNSGYGKSAQKNFTTDAQKLKRYAPIAWFCTSYARRALFLCKKMLNCPLLYSDTDSFYVYKQDAEKLKNNYPELFENELGDIMNNELHLDWENDYSEICVIAKKIYGVKNDSGEFVKCKGIRDATYKDILELCRKPVVMEQKRSKTCWTDSNGVAVVAPIESMKIIIKKNIPVYCTKCTVCNYYHTAPISNIPE